MTATKDDLTATKDDLTAYYQNLLIVQYHNKPKAKAEAGMRAKNAAGDFIFLEWWRNFDVDTAVGVQLDLIGKIVGLSRIVYAFEFENNYFSLNDTTNLMAVPTGRGFSTVANPVKGGIRSVLQSKRSKYAMNDSQYRIMIKLKIAYNNAVNTNKFIDDEVYRLFGKDVIVTNNFNMTMTVTVKQNQNINVKIAEFLGIFIVPLGVDIIYDYL